MIAPLRTFRAHRVSGDVGLTLVELLVVMVVMSVICGAVAAIFSATLRTTGATSTKLDQGNQARVAMEAMTRVLRTVVVPVQLSDNCDGCTDAFIEGKPFEVAFYADIDNEDNNVGPSRVLLSTSASGTLTETIQPPDPDSVSSGNFTWSGQNDPTCTAGAAGCLKRRTVLADGVKQDATKPMFTYYAYNTGATLTGTLGPADMRNVDAIDIVITLSLPDRSPVAPTTYVSRVALSNIDVYVVDHEDGD